MTPQDENISLPAPLDIPSKVCIHCKLSLPLDNFYDSKVNRGGKANRCKQCISDYGKYRYEHRNDPPKIRVIGPKVCSRNDCSRAGEVQPMENFYKYKRGFDGLSAACKTCVNKQRDEWRRKKGLQTPKRERTYEFEPNTWIAYKYPRIRYRALKKGIPFDMEPSDLADMPELCPVLGCKLDYDRRGDRRLWASVDRIIPALGYVKGNIRIISMAANLAKLDGIGDIYPSASRDVSRIEEPDAEFFFRFTPNSTIKGF